VTVRRVAERRFDAFQRSSTDDTNDAVCRRGSAGAGARLQGDCNLPTVYWKECLIVLSVVVTSEILRRAHDSAPQTEVFSLVLIIRENEKKRFV